MAHAWTICREVDLARDFVGVERIAALATTSAKAAHELHIAVKSGGEPIGMDGASVLLNLILPDGVSTTADGRIEAGACIAMLPSLCYQRGETRGVLLLQFGTQAAIPVYAFVLRCFEDLTDAFADPDHVIPSLAELLAQLDAAKNAAKAAQDGASAANAAAGAANAAAGNANEAAGMASAAANTANTAAIHANSAKEAANAAAARLDGLTATATGLDAGSAPTVDVTTGEDGARVLSFGIPKGDKGDTGAQGEKGEKGDPGRDGSPGATGATPRFTVTAVTGEAGTAASVTQSGTAENPMVEFTIPQGMKGDTGATGEKGEKGDPGKDAPQEVVLYTAQTLDDAQKAQARENIGAASATTVSSLKTDVDAKINQSDALTLEEIMASTDLSKKVASAEAVKSIKNNVGSIKSGGFYSEKTKGNTMPADYGGFIRISGGSWPGSYYSDTYYVGVSSSSNAFLGIQINGAKQITWVQI